MLFPGEDQTRVSHAGIHLLLYESCLSPWQWDQADASVVDWSHAGEEQCQEDMSECDGESGSSEESGGSVEWAPSTGTADGWGPDTDSLTLTSI